MYIVYFNLPLILCPNKNYISNQQNKNCTKQEDVKTHAALLWLLNTQLSKVFFIKHCQTERHYYNEYISINTHVYTLSSHDQQSKSVPFCQSFTLQIHMWLKLNVLVNTEQNHLSNFLACLLNNSTRASLWIGVIEVCLAHAVVWLASNMLHKLRNYLIFIIVWFR